MIIIITVTSIKKMSTKDKTKQRKIQQKHAHTDLVGHATLSHDAKPPAQRAGVGVSMLTAC